MRVRHRHVGGAQRLQLAGARPDPARNAADAGDRLSAQRRGEHVGRRAGCSIPSTALGAEVGAGNQHEIGPVRADPAPERVRLGMLSICDAGRWKLERRALGIRDWHGEQVERAVALALFFVAFDGGAHRCGRGVVAI